MKKKTASQKSQTGFARLDKMKDEDIDYSDAPAITPEMFAKAVVHRGGLKPRTKKQVTLRMDSDVLKWFKKQRSIEPYIATGREAHHKDLTRTSRN